MKLVTYVNASHQHNPKTEMVAQRHFHGQGGVLLNGRIYDLSQVCAWVEARKEIPLDRRANSVLEFVHLPQEQRKILASMISGLPSSGLNSLDLASVRLRAPIEMPPSVRDFYAFEEHVKTARLNRGLSMIPEWYKFPTFYFSNNRAIYGPEEYIPYPRNSEALDFELEMACVIGKAGRDIKAEKAADYIAGYLILNDWSARDLQLEEMRIGLGPAKGKDFATSLGPCLVTPEELQDKRIGEGPSQRLDLTMTARLNGKEISRGNFKDIYYTFCQMVERASMNVWLEPGDIIGSGTVGTGCLLELGDKRERWLQPGDVVELEIERIGVLRNTIVAQD
jgi:fumarylacetoacetate (FAA) hydrolase